MRVKKILSIILITMLCVVKINSQTNISDLPVLSTQTDTLIIMTYNLQKQEYRQHAEIMRTIGADIVAVQEIFGFGKRNFNVLRKETGLEGKMCATINIMGLFRYGIALLWNEESLGKPISVKCYRIRTPKDNNDPRRAYILAEFNDFFVISTHFSTNVDENKKMVEAILSKDFIVNYRKPVFIAGDLNPRPRGGNPRETDGFETITALKAKGFEMLNNTDRNDPEFLAKHATTQGGGQPDLVLGLNQNPNREIIDRGIPANADRTFTILDHLPYLVKIKIR